METIVSKNTKAVTTYVVDENASLNAELEYLMQLDTADKSKLVVENFNPLSSQACFLAMIWGSPLDAASRIEIAKYRNSVGKLPFQFLKRHRHGEMTPLETWAAELWDRDEKETVLNVVRYLKGEITEKPILTFG